MNSGVSLKVESQRPRAISTQPPELCFVARTAGIAKSEELTLSEIAKLTVTTRICTLGYHKTSAVDGDQQSARPNARLLSSADQCANRLPVKGSPDPSDLRRQIPGLTAPQRAESKYGREWMAQRSLTCGIQTLYRLLSLASDMQFLKLL